MSKRNLNKIPKNVRVKINKLDEQYLVAGCARVYKKADLVGGVLHHLGIYLENELVVSKEEVLPSAERGKYSNRNIYGFEVKRKDLPKETDYNAIESPNWGDPSNGTHTVNLPFERYPRDFFAPEFLQIKITAKEVYKNEEYVITFQIDKILNKDDEDFERQLLFCLNILQENVGYCDIQKVGSDFGDYVKTTHIDWDILPVGSKDDVINRIFSRRKDVPIEQKNVARARYDFFNELAPEKYISGTSGLQRYFGALISNELVVFENLEYGNAIYVMFDSWKELSKKTRIQLLSGRYGDNFRRVLHLPGWENRVKDIIKAYRIK